MGYLVVISLPVILLLMILAIACYLIGRARGREEASRLPYYGPPPPSLPPPAPPLGVESHK
ncbi:hypothetical protein LguiA_016107 [Lonicera macranthoides]